MVRAVPESTEIATKAVRVCVSVGRRGCVCQCSWHASPVRVQSPAFHALRVCQDMAATWRHSLCGSWLPSAPALRVLHLVGGWTSYSFSSAVWGGKAHLLSTCVSTGPAQPLACLSLDTVPTARTGSAPHIRLRHQPGDLWSLSPVARERVFKKTHRHVIKISVLGFGEGAGRLPPLLSGNTDLRCLKVTRG